MEQVKEIREKFPSNELSYIILLVIVILSLLILIFIAIITVISKVKISFRLIIMFNLLFANFMNTFSYILNYSFQYGLKYYPYYDNNSLCTSQAFLLISFSTSRDFWIFVITFVTYRRVVYNDLFKKTQLDLLYMFLCAMLFGSFIYFFFFQHARRSWDM